MNERTGRIRGYAVVFENTGTGYSCYAPAIPGCASAGRTFTECKKSMAEAIDFHFEGLREDGLPIPPRDGRTLPRPYRLKGRTVAISSRVSPKTAELLNKIVSVKRISKTEAIEMAVAMCGKQLHIKE